MAIGHSVATTPDTFRQHEGACIVVLKYIPTTRSVTTAPVQSVFCSNTQLCAIRDTRLIARHARSLICAEQESKHLSSTQKDYPEIFIIHQNLVHLTRRGALSGAGRGIPSQLLPTPGLLQCQEMPGVGCKFSASIPVGTDCSKPRRPSERHR